VHLSLLLPSSIRLFFFCMPPRPTISTLFPYTTLFRSFTIRSRRMDRTVAVGTTVNAVYDRTMDRSSINRQTFTLTEEGAKSNIRSEEHTSELQSRENPVCRLLLEKKKQIEIIHPSLIV